MAFTKEQIRKRLDQMSREDLADLVANLYVHYPQIQSAVNKAAGTKEDAENVLSNIKKYSAGECKTALQAYIRTIKNRKDKVLCYFSFVESVLDQKGQLDFRFISVASAAYGKAMDLLSRDRALWDEMLDRSYEIACRFYDIGTGEAAYHAVEYYTRVKHAFDGQ